MQLTQYALLYVITTGVFFGIDVIWLGFIARKLYNNYLGHLLATTVVWPAALLFYALYIVGILFFALVPALREASPQRALINGALFGFLTYMTYDLTNWATLKDWPWQIVVIDVAWGTALTAVVAGISFMIASKVI